MNSDSHDLNCPVEATLKLIGGKYKSLILWHLVDGTLRHGELQKLIPQATPKMLTERFATGNFKSSYRRRPLKC